MTEIMPVPRKLRITVLPAGSLSAPSLSLSLAAFEIVFDCTCCSAVDLEYLSVGHKYVVAPFGSAFHLYDLAGVEPEPGVIGHGQDDLCAHCVAPFLIGPNFQALMGNFINIISYLLPLVNFLMGHLAFADEFAIMEEKEGEAIS